MHPWLAQAAPASLASSKALRLERASRAGAADEVHVEIHSTLNFAHFTLNALWLPPDIASKNPFSSKTYALKAEPRGKCIVLREGGPCEVGQILDARQLRCIRDKRPSRATGPEKKDHHQRLECEEALTRPSSATAADPLLSFPKAVASVPKAAETGNRTPYTVSITNDQRLCPGESHCPTGCDTAARNRWASV